MHLLGNIQNTAIKRIRELVKVRKNERTFDQIADAADIHVRTLHRYLEEKGPSFDMKLSTLEGFAEVLGVAPEYLISENAPAPVIIEPTPEKAIAVLTDFVEKALADRSEKPTQAPPSLSIPGIDSAKLDELATLLTKRPKAINGVLNALRGRGDISDKVKDSG